MELCRPARPEGQPARCEGQPLLGVCQEGPRVSLPDLRASQPGLRASQPARLEGQPARLEGQPARPEGRLRREEQTDVWIYNHEQNFFPFYSSSPIGSTAQKTMLNILRQSIFEQGWIHYQKWRIIVSAHLLAKQDGRME